jgi:hypothetical protein
MYKLIYMIEKYQIFLKILVTHRWQIICSLLYKKYYGAYKMVIFCVTSQWYNKIEKEKEKRYTVRNQSRSISAQNGPTFADRSFRNRRHWSHSYLI